MERGLIVQDYFHLRDYLNRANKLSNRQTELQFEIEPVGLKEFRLFAVAIGAHESHRIAIAERTPARIWERTGHTAFRPIEEFSAKILNEHERTISFRSPFRLNDEQQKELCRNLKKIFTMLLLNKNYEP